jgi:hypothetical protein
VLGQLLLFLSSPGFDNEVVARNLLSESFLRLTMARKQTKQSILDDCVSDE